MRTKCPVCGGKLAAGGKVTFKNPRTKRPITRDVVRCRSCDYRTVMK